jgi:hypothetical protein
MLSGVDENPCTPAKKGRSMTDDDDKYREIHQRINAIHRQNQLDGKSNQPLLVDWSEVDKEAQKMVAVGNAKVAGLEESPTAKKVAADMRSWHEDQWRNLGGIPYDTRFCPEFDETNPGTQFYAITYGQGCALFPLPNLHAWEDVAALALCNDTGCGAHVTVFCKAVQPHGVDEYQVFAVKRGEIICVVKCCSQCFEYLRSAQADDFDYIGPREHWMADDSNNPQC